jgi:hypothetical protein
MLHQRKRKASICASHLLHIYLPTHHAMPALSGSPHTTSKVSLCASCHQHQQQHNSRNSPSAAKLHIAMHTAKHTPNVQSASCTPNHACNRGRRHLIHAAASIAASGTCSAFTYTHRAMPALFASPQTTSEVRPGASCHSCGLLLGNLRSTKTLNPGS